LLFLFLPAVHQCADLEATRSADDALPTADDPPTGRLAPVTGAPVGAEGRNRPGTDKGMDAGTDEGTDKGTDRGIDTDEGRWLTYGELAAQRRIDRHSAVKLVTRHRWRRQKDNHGILRILVPFEWAMSRDKGTDAATDRGTGEGTDKGTDTGAFEAALTAIEAAHANETRALCGQLDTAEQGRLAAQALADRALASLADAEVRISAERVRIDQADGDRRSAEARAERAETAIAGERQRADALRATIDELKAGQALMVDMHARELNEARAVAEAAQHAAEEAQEAAEELRQAETARKARGRLRRAWDGWRGR
jgi:hypothetical protein